MRLGWREGIHACAAGDRWILLDLRTGRFRAVPTAISIALPDLLAVEGEITDRADEVLAPLMAEGTIVAVSASAREPGGSPTPPHRDRDRGAGGPVPTVYVWMALAAQLVAEGLLRTVRFAGVYRLTSNIDARPQAAGRPGDEAIVARIGEALSRSDRLLSRNDRCLARSVAFKLLALALGVRVRLVIGVQSQPFAAHCWVDRDGTVLNDELDLVGRFTPILAV